MKKAVIFGASGFVGSCLLTELLNNPEYDQVTAIVRKELAVYHPKLKTVIGDIDSLPKLKNEIVGDDIFIAIGTTKKHVPDEKKYYRIDHDYPVLAARLAKENGAQSVFIVTAVGANRKSKAFYIRTKGEIERDIIALEFPHTHIFRPSMIMGNRAEHRSMEKFLINIWGGLNPLLAGPLEKYRGIEGQQIAKAMNQAAKVQSRKLKIHHWADMAKA